MFVKMKTAHDEEDIMLNTKHIVLVTYYSESNMSKVDTILQGKSIWLDGNFMDVMKEIEQIAEVKA